MPFFTPESQCIFAPESHAAGGSHSATERAKPCVTRAGLHQVHSIGDGPAVSVNLFGECAELAAFNQIEALPVPFEDSWTRPIRLAAAPALMATIYGLVEGCHVRSVQWPTRTEDARRADSSAGGLDDADGDCSVAFYRAVQQWSASRWESLAGSTDAVMATCDTSHALFTSDHFRSRARDIAAGFLRLRPDGPRFVLQQNYWDTLVSFTMEWEPARAARYAYDIAALCFAAA